MLTEVRVRVCEIDRVREGESAGRQINRLNRQTSAHFRFSVETGRVDDCNCSCRSCAGVRGWVCVCECYVHVHVCVRIAYICLCRHSKHFHTLVKILCANANMSCNRCLCISGVRVRVFVFVCLPNYIPEIKRWLIVPINENNDGHWMQTRQSDGSNKTLPKRCWRHLSSSQLSRDRGQQTFARTLTAPRCFPSNSPPPRSHNCVTFLLSAFGTKLLTSLFPTQR